jgi:hypothetical protein
MQSQSRLKFSKKKKKTSVKMSFSDNDDNDDNDTMLVDNKLNNADDNSGGGGDYPDDIVLDEMSFDLSFHPSVDCVVVGNIEGILDG